MKKILYITLGILIALGVSVHASVTNPFHIWEGGTGTTTAPTYGKTLVGDANGNYEYVATSTFGGGGGSGTVTSITASSPLTGGTITTSGSIGCTTADTSHAGCLTSTDWNTFNGKQPAGSYITLSSLTGDSPIGYNTGTGHISCSTCNTSSASVTSVGLSDSNSTLTIGGTPITSSGTLTATLNLAHANTWTALQNFNGNASTTLFSSTYASSTIGNIGTLTLPNLGTAAGSFLAVNPSGQVIATTTPTGASGITAIGVTTANGVSGTSSGGTTPSLTLTLGAITPSTVNGLTLGLGQNSQVNNIALGSGALGGVLTGGNFNTAIGTNSLGGNTTGKYNTGNGYASLYYNTTGSYNTAVGDQTGNDGNGEYDADTFIGSFIGFGGNSAISSSTIIGYNAGYNLAGNSNVMIGDSAGYNYLGSNGFFLNNIQQTTQANDQNYSLLYGKFSGTAGSLTGQMLDVNGNLGVGTTTPAVAVDVKGSIVSEENRIAFSATPTIDWSTSNQVQMTLTNNVTSMTFSNGQPGGAYRLILCQDGTGSRTVAGWDSKILWTNGATTTQTATANKCDLYTFTATYATTTALEYFGGYVQNF